MRLKRRAETLMLWPEDHPASPPRWQDDGREVLTCDGSGLSFSASAARLVPAGSWQRTLSESLALSLTGSTGCAVSLRVRATNCGRSLLVPTMLGRPTGGSACGLSPGSDWPTVTANESPTRFNQGGSNGRVGPKRPMLAGAVALWPTATSSIDSGSAAYSTESGRHPGTTLTDAANGLWASPQARDWKDSGPTQGNRKSPNLGTQANTGWPTPRVTTSGMTASEAQIGRIQRGEESERGAGACKLEITVALEERAGLLAPGSPSTSGKRRGWQTPQRRDGEPRGTQPMSVRRAQGHSSTLPDQLAEEHAELVRLGLRTPSEDGERWVDEPEPKSRGSLNPAWVSQLMGFPTGWLAASPPDTVARRLKASAIRLSRKLRK